MNINNELSNQTGIFNKKMRIKQSINWRKKTHTGNLMRQKQQQQIWQTRQNFNQLKLVFLLIDWVVSRFYMYGLPVCVCKIKSNKTSTNLNVIDPS